VTFSAITIEQEGRATKTRVTFYYRFHRRFRGACPLVSLLTFQKLRANNTSSCRSNSKEREGLSLLKDLAKKKTRTISCFPQISLLSDALYSTLIIQ